MKCIIAIIHQNKHNNPLFQDLQPYFDLIRKVSHHYSVEAEKLFFDNKQMAAVFYLFAKSMNSSNEIIDFIEN
jgi:hypothetical protein